MNTRKTLAAFATASALALPLVLAGASPALACGNDNTCNTPPTSTGTAPPLLDARIHLGVRGSTCGDDTLLLIQVEAKAGGVHKSYLDAQSADSTAQTGLHAAKATDLNAENAVVAAQNKVNADNAAIAADNDGADVTPDAQDTAAAAAKTALSGDTTALGKANTAEGQADTALEAARHNADTTHATLVSTRNANTDIVARIRLLTDRINGECHTPPPTTVTIPPTTDTPAPPPAAIVPPSSSNNTQVIVQGPQPVIVPGTPQVVQAPQGFVSAGGGADADAVAGFSS